jgi:hypothetical protein
MGVAPKQSSNAKAFLKAILMNFSRLQRLPPVLE